MSSYQIRMVSAVLFAGLPVMGIGATLELHAGSGSKTFENVSFHGASHDQAKGFVFHMAPPPGARAYPVPAVRVKAIELSDAEKETRYHMVLNGSDGNFRRFENVTFQAIEPSRFLAVPAGGTRAFPIPAETVVSIELAERAEGGGASLWQAQVAAQTFVVSGPRAAKPVSDQSRAIISTEHRRYASQEAPSAPTPVDPSALIGKPFPSVTFTGASGDSFTLDEVREGKPVVLVLLRGFPGYVCPYCTAQTAALIDSLPAIERLDARVALVFPGQADTVPLFLSAVRDYRQRDAVPVPVLFDTNLAAVRSLGVEGKLAKPTTVIVDKQGVVRYAYVGSGFNDRPSAGLILAVLSRLQQSP